MTAQTETPQRSYGCTFACGNPYDYILVDVQSGETLLLCMPCFLKVAGDMVEAVTDPDSPINLKVSEAGIQAIGDSVPGPSGHKRGKNAPATADDPDLITAYEDTITEDELPDEFR